MSGQSFGMFGQKKNAEFGQVLPFNCCIVIGASQVSSLVMFAAATTLPLAINQILDGLQANDIDAYNICLAFEKSAPAGSNALIHARVLGYLMIHSPSRAALVRLSRQYIHAQEIIRSCPSSDRVSSTISSGLKFKSRTPIPSDHSSRPSFDKFKYVRPTVVEAPRTHKEAKDLALLRDGFRCVVTGTYDGTRSLKFRICPDASAVYTLDYAASVLAVLRCFGYDTEIYGTKAHSLFNVMTIWFEKTETITFTTPDSENLPVPSETLLVLHAACAQVAQLSGAAQYIDRLDCDAEDLGVLACDGSSGEVLTGALLSRMNKIIGIGT
ncbi:hypothetical protein BD779DRAFT_1791831 [Infundibulicybe gibba]|nr:hypothetical protein BD779DRAFT_1791831 [Infundibulicybe gibba]